MNNETYFFVSKYAIQIHRYLIEVVNIVNYINYMIIALILLIMTTIIFSYRFQIIVNRIDKNYSIDASNTKQIGILDTKSKKLKYYDALLFTILGGIANLGGFGKLGIPTKAVLLKKHGYSINTSVTAIAIDTTFDIIFSAFILIIAILYIPAMNIIDFFDLRIIAISLIILILIGIKFRNKKWFSMSIDSFKKIDRPTALKLLAMTLISWILASVSYYFLLGSTNEKADILVTFIIFSISIVVGIISPIAGGIGVREGILALLSTTINIPPGKGLLIAIIHRILTIISLLFLLVIAKLKRSATDEVYSSQNDYASKNQREIKAKKIISILQKDIIIRNNTVLEIGSGYGHIINQFNKIGNYTIGIDRSFNLVKSSKTNHENCEFVCGDGTLLPVKGNSIDIIILNHVIEHTNHKDELIKECRRVLKEKGVIYIATPNKHFPIDPHTKIPFFGYMGRKIHNKYNIHNPTKTELIELLEQNSFSYNYISIYILSNLSDFEEYNTLVYKLISKFFSVFTIKDFLIPTHIFIARKLYS